MEKVIVKTKKTKKQALINFISGEQFLSKADEKDLVDELEHYDDNQDDFESCYGDYLVYTDEEANSAVNEYIKDNVWSFNADFIIEHSKLPYDAKEMVQNFQEQKCEDANETILALIEDTEKFIDDAIGLDGRGNFLNNYDGEEYEQDNYFIYRTN